MTKDSVPWAPLPCERPGCRCTHTGGCEAGWLETKLHKDGRWYDAVKPCPICRPDRQSTDAEKATGLAGRDRWLARLRETNAKSARNKSDDW